MLTLKFRFDVLKQSFQSAPINTYKGTKTVLGVFCPLNSVNYCEKREYTILQRYIFQQDLIRSGNKSPITNIKTPKKPTYKPVSPVSRYPKSVQRRLKLQDIKEKSKLKKGRFFSFTHFWSVFLMKV
jgi:hypothetical protein